MMITCLAGGTGAGKLLAGLVHVTDPKDITVIVNVGDDFMLHGLYISPDLDTIMYTLANVANSETGWGIAGETWEVTQALEQYRGETWFKLGDKDLATHLYRTQRMTEGATLSVITAELTGSWGIQTRLLPMSDDPVRTMITLDTGGMNDTAKTEVAFQEYFVRLKHQVPIAKVRFSGVHQASPAPGVIKALVQSDLIVVCPSNPIVSIGPILAVDKISETLMQQREKVVAISPIVNGMALKGPADRMMKELGHEPSALGVAKLYADWVKTMVVDTSDVGFAPLIESLGMSCIVTQTVMSSLDLAVELGKALLS
ncbi:MAG: 2-phospho-L-lactate transferase [Actinobacteria bacterium]|nr:2-phospho-L-lactate transferase [Actinomycetota bacterium]MCL6105299.1 2-phospho-L-lactate transferase [Actinomycetota bacterium]